MVTYILGAGASAESIPVADKLQESLSSFSSYLKVNSKTLDDEWKIQLNDSSLFHAKEYLEDLAVKVNTLLAESKHHQTIDTYARKLFLTKERDKYLNLKTVLCCYFSWVQNRTPIAKRYDHFIASIIDDINPINQKSVIPQGIKIISWNYDLQLEMALSKYLNYCVTCEDILKFANISTQYCSNFSDYSITKINGCCLLGNNQNYYNAYELPDYNEEDYDRISLEKCISSYYLILKGICKPLLNFAWENKEMFEKNLNNNTIESRGQDIYATENLIIIGYSFPNFNRQIDKGLLNKMIKLKNVYVQSPESKGVIFKIKSYLDNKDVNFIPVEDLSQFFLPPEL